MTLQEIKTLHAFSSWATNRILDALAQMPEDLYVKDMKSSHGGIHGTLVHLIGAEKRWLARFNGIPAQKLPSMEGIASLKEAKAAWEATGFDMARFLGTMTDKKLQDRFTMTLSSGQTFQHTYVQGFLHAIDHSTYHRGQIVSMMRQAGVKPPNTSMIGFFRETAPLM